MSSSNFTKIWANAKKTIKEIKDSAPIDFSAKEAIIKSYKPIPEPTKEEIEQDKKEHNATKHRSWGGRWFCPCCGHQLADIEADNENWFDFVWEKEKRTGTEYFLCTNKECVYFDLPLLLFHPFHGIDRPAGDSWAMGFVK